MITVNALSKHCGVSTHTVRYYSRIGLLKPRRQPQNGYRLFARSDVDRLSFIRRAQNIGFTLSEIFEILSIAESGYSPCKRVRAILLQRIEENRTKLNEFTALQERMEKTLAQWQNLPDGSPGKQSICRLIESAGEALDAEDCCAPAGGHYV